jgi:tellurite resistance protein
MKADQGDLCVRVLSAIAWSDGEVTDDEMDKVLDVVMQLDYADGPRVQELLQIPTRFNHMDAIRALDRNTRLRLLHDGYLVAVQDKPLDEPERDILQQIAGCVIEGKNWEDVEACLDAYAKYEARCRRLWGLTHLA